MDHAAAGPHLVRRLAVAIQGGTAAGTGAPIHGLTMISRPAPHVAPGRMAGLTLIPYGAENLSSTAEDITKDPA